MQKITILNTREIKKIRELCLDYFGYFPEKDYAYLSNEKNKIFIINMEIQKIELSKLRIDKIGLYFAELKDTQFRLSQEGAQLLAIEAHQNGQKLKNVIELNKEEVEQYFRGNNIPKDLGENKLVLLKYNQDIWGCTKYKAGIIINFLSKIHRGNVIA